MTEGGVIPVGKLLRSGYSQILMYPHSDEKEAKTRSVELTGLGVTVLEFRGRTLVNGIPLSLIHI